MKMRKVIRFFPLFACLFSALFLLTNCGPSSKAKGKPAMYQKLFSINQPVTFDKQRFIVTKVQRNYQPPATDQFSPQVPAGKEWFVISVKIENNAKHAFTFHRENIFLQDAKKKIYRGSPLTGNIGRPGFISMGDWMHGGLLFEIPQGATGLTLYYQPKYLQKKNQIIAIKVA